MTRNILHTFTFFILCTSASLSSVIAVAVTPVVQEKKKIDFSTGWKRYVVYGVAGAATSFAIDTYADYYRNHEKNSQKTELFPADTITIVGLTILTICGTTDVITKLGSLHNDDFKNNASYKDNAAVIFGGVGISAVGLLYQKYNS